MARKKSGGFSRVLNFIGLVDDPQPRDEYGDEYENGDYGRAQTYAPRRDVRQQNMSRGRQELASRRPSAYEPTRVPRMNRPNNVSAGRFDQGTRPAQQGMRRNDNFDMQNSRTSYDYSPRAARFMEPEQNDTYADTHMRTQPQQRPAQRTRTVMFSLRSIEDCCDVIDNLILNNTVVLTMNDLDATLLQRALDTLSGAVFALRAVIRKASDRTYLIAPNGTEIDETYEMDRRFSI